LGTLRAYRTEKLPSNKDITVVRHPEDTPCPRTYQVPSAIVLKFSAGPRLCLGESPHTNVVTTVPFDANLSVANPHDTAAFLGVSFYAGAAIAHTNDAAAGRHGFPKHPIAVRRIVPEHARDRLACRGVRRSRVRGDLYVKY